MDTPDKPVDHAPSGAPAHAASHGSGAALVLSAIGVVFGDIGTSPLYTIQECVGGAHGVAATQANVLGILSLIFWSLMLVVTVKYLAVVMRADNGGEGGIFALLALMPERVTRVVRGRVRWVPLLVIAGAGLLFGDGIITPAISVLSAVEGLRVPFTGHELALVNRVIVPLTCVILLGLFALQRRGTGGIGKLFGPVMVLWFTTIAGLGLRQVVHNPAVLSGLSPHHGVLFFARNGFHGFRLLGSVVLAVTGGEALYADMGHFGRRPIRLAWLGLVLPALVLCYAGQCALLLSNPAAASQPFFSMVNGRTQVFLLVALAAPATVIASQALISGVFSLTHQAIRLGYFPRLRVNHTASDAEGQIYLPTMNWFLAVACILLVLVFKHSESLAAAFGLAVSGTMAITSVLFYVVARDTWGWSRAKALPLLLLFLSFDVPFFFANVLKFWDGGYLPLVVGAFFFVAMVLWRRGRSLLGEYHASRSEPLETFIADLSVNKIARVPGMGVVMASSPTGVPPVLAHLVRRVKAVHQEVVLLTVLTQHVPTVAMAERVSFESLGGGFYRVVARYGFMEAPRVGEIVELAQQKGLPAVKGESTFFLGRETFVGGAGGEMGAWEETVFAALSRNAGSATAYFGVPPEQVLELGTQIDL